MVGSLLDKLLLREPTSGYSSNCDEAILELPRSYISFAQHVLGIFAKFGETLPLILAKSKESSSVDEEEIKRKIG